MHRRSGLQAHLIHLLWSAGSYNLWRGLTNGSPPPKNGSAYWNKAIAQIPSLHRRTIESLSPERADALFLGYLNENAERVVSLAASPPPAEEPEGVHASPRRCILRIGSMRLLHYAPVGRSKRGAAPFLLSPSMINRSYIMDFLPGCSLVEDLCRRGYSCYLIDRDSPEDEERLWDMETYLTRHVLPAAHAALLHSGSRRLVPVGYCMGGLTALALARLTPPGTIQGVALFGMPWDFSSMAAALRPFLALFADRLTRSPSPPFVPADAVRTLFYTLYWPAALKRRRQREGGGGPHAQKLERWLSDGVDLSPRLTADLIGSWLVENLPYRGEWRIGGRAVDLTRLRCPVWLCAGRKDAIVPLASSLAAARQLRDVSVRLYPGGHVGMMADAHAGRSCRDSLAEWRESL
jgi:polyhydroxyalkanoate synthase